MKRVSGGRWRMIVLGHVLAEHVLELRGRARVVTILSSTIILRSRRVSSGSADMMIVD